MSELIEHSIPFYFEMAIGNVEADSGGKFYYLSGIATDNLPDKQNQRFSKTFIQNMVEGAVGMTCFYEHKRDLDHSIGYCKEANVIEDALHVNIQLEDPDNNELVKKIIAKNNNGVKIGLSVSGVVTKSSYDTEVGKSEDGVEGDDSEPGIQVLEEGRLDEISAVGLPANPRGWASVIFKSMEKSMEVNDMSQEETKETTVESTEIEDVQEQQEEIVVEKDLDSIIAQLQSEIEVLKAKVAPADAEDEEEEEDEDEIKKEEQPAIDAPAEAPVDSPSEGDDSASKEDVLMVSQEIVSGISGAISASMEQLTGVMEMLRATIEGQTQEVQANLDRIKEKVDYIEKSHYDHIENMVRTEGGRVESSVKNAITKKEEASSEDIKKSFSDVDEKLQTVQEGINNFFESEEFKVAVQQSVEDSIRSLQSNPSPVRKSQGNKSFNKPDEHIQDESGKVDVEQVHPLSVSKSEFDNLNKDERIRVLNRGLSVMTGFGN